MQERHWVRKKTTESGCCILFCIYFYSCSTFCQWWMYRDTQWLSVPVVSPEHTVLQWPCKPRTSGDHGPLLEHHLHALCACPPACALDRCFPESSLWTMSTAGLVATLWPSAHLPQAQFVMHLEGCFHESSSHGHHDSNSPVKALLLLSLYIQA